MLLPLQGLRAYEQYSRLLAAWQDQLSDAVQSQLQSLFQSLVSSFLGAAKIKVRRISVASLPDWQGSMHGFVPQVVWVGPPCHLVLCASAVDAPLSSSFIAQQCMHPLCLARWLICCGTQETLTDGRPIYVQSISSRPHILAHCCIACGGVILAGGKLPLRLLVLVVAAAGPRPYAQR